MVNVLFIDLPAYVTTKLKSCLHVAAFTCCAVVMFSSCAVAAPSTTVIKRPGISKVAAFVTRKLFASPQIGTITDIAVNPTARTVTAGGDSGAAISSADGKIISTVKYAEVDTPVSLVPVGTSSAYDYLSRGGWASPCCLIDSAGTTIWTAPAGEGVDDAVAGDFLGNGSTQVVVSYNGGDGVSMFDGSQTPLWNKPDGNNWHIAAYRDAKSAAWRTINSDARGQIVIRDNTGTVLATAKPPFYFSYFSICSWPTTKSPVRILAYADKEVNVLTFEGAVLEEYTVPHAADEAWIYGAPVHLRSSIENDFAILEASSSIASPPGVLSIFNSSGKLVYHETLPEQCGDLAVLPATTPGQPDTLLVGGTNHIWAYR